MALTPTARRRLVFIAALALTALTARLGWWQLDRASQKLQWAQAQQEKMQLPALTLAELPSTPEQAQAANHRAVALQGQWAPAHTVYLENRQMNGRVGFYALTPLLLDDGSAILVQRGWLPRDQVDRLRIVAPPAPAGVHRVQGRMALAPSRLFELQGAASGLVRQNLEADVYRKETQLPLRPGIVIQETAADTSDDGLLRQWPAVAATADKNYGYAAQWFALSALTAGLWLWFQVLQPQRRRAHAQASPTSRP